MGNPTLLVAHRVERRPAPGGSKMLAFAFSRGALPRETTALVAAPGGPPHEGKSLANECRASRATPLRRRRPDSQSGGGDFVEVLRRCSTMGRRPGGTFPDAI
jgi:hypothetical protein